MASGADVVNAALSEKSEIGGAYLTNSQSGNKYCAWYGMDGYWCAMFVSYVMSKAGVSTSIVPKYSWCQDCIDFAREQGRLYSSSQIVNGQYAPQPGDVFFRSGDHTGIVVSVSGSQFTTVEGNTQGGGSGQRTVGGHTFYFDGNSVDGGTSYTHIFHPDYDESSEYSTYATITPQKTIEVPSGLGGYYTYMNWDTITNMDTEQGRLINQAGKSYDSEGYGKIGERYTVAMTSTFGDIGDYVDIYMSNGRVIKGIIADEKSQVYTSWDHNPANKWGHENGQCIVEWVTNWYDHENPDSDGTVLKVLNYGSYFDNPDYATNSDTYMYSENSYTSGTTEPTVVWNNRTHENIQPKLQSTETIQSTGTLSLYVNGTDITAYTGSLEWQNSIHELATTMTFETPKTDAAYLTDWITVPVCGDTVQLVTNEEVFRGVITKIDDGNININKYTAVDLGWYLNKTSQTYQFKNITATNAIEELCADLSINIVSLPELTTNINQIYFDKTISAILTDILDQCDGDYNYDFVPEGLRIYEIGDLVAYPEFRIASNIPQISSIEYRGDVSHTSSIEDMKNSVKVTSEKDNVYTELVVKQNQESINQYGFLQEIVKIDTEQENAETVATEKLNELCKVGESYSFEIIEKYDSYTRAGEVIEIDGAKYVIESTNHSFKGGHHYNKLEVERI